MLIILEGVDCAGKTTLANQLAEELGGAQILHRGPPEQHPLIEYEKALDWYRPGGVSNHAICDRWHLGADVYGPLMRDDPGLEPEVRWHIEAYLRSRGGMLVLVEPPSPEVMLERMHTRGEDYVNDAQALHCLGAFRGVYDLSHLTKTVYNGTVPISLLLDVANSLEETATELTPFPSYVGPPLPRVLLLGDRRNTFSNERDGDAAFMPYNATSGKWLLDALGDVDDVGVANACEIGRDLPRLIEALGLPKIVTMGTAAAGQCDTVGLEHTHVFHPQYMRRFHHGDSEAYGKDLRCE